MDCLKDVAEISVPAGSCKFDYLLAVCERERLLLEKEERKNQETLNKGGYDDEYYLCGVDLDENLIKIPSTGGKNDDKKEVVIVDKILDERKQASNPKTPEISILPKEEWKKKLMGSFDGCLSWQRSVIIPSTTRSKTPETVISHSSDGGRASSNRIRKRLRYDEMEERMNSKKQKRGIRVANNGPEPTPGLPVEFRNLILQLAGNRAVSVEKLVIQKELTATDVNSTHNRLSIPVRLVREVFVTEEEEVLLCQHKGKNVCSIDEVPFITPMMEVAKVSLRRWEMKKKNGASSVSYVIASTWNEIRRRNKFQSQMIVQLWAIRVEGDLWLALVRLS